MGTLHGDLRTFITSSRWTLIRIRNVAYKSRREIQNIYFIFNNFFPPKIIRLMRQCGNIWYNQTGYKWQYNARRMMWFACRTKAGIQIQTRYVTLVFLRQKMIRERASMLRYTYISCLVNRVRGFEWGVITCTPIHETYFGGSRHKQRAYNFWSLKVMIQVTTQLHQNNQNALEMQCRYTYVLHPGTICHMILTSRPNTTDPPQKEVIYCLRSSSC